MKRNIIDSHMHLGQWEKDGYDNIFENLRRFQESNDFVAVDNMCCSNNGKLWEDIEPDQSILGAIAKLENPSVFTHGCLYLPNDHRDFKNFNFKNQLDELMEIGLDGIKICDFKPDAYKLFHVGEHLEEYDEFIGYCEENNVHMCWHVADPENFWDAENVHPSIKAAGWFYGDGTHPTYAELTDMTYSLIEAHPRLNLLLAHIFFKSYEPDEVIALLEKYPNVCLDMAPGWEMFSGFKANYDEWSKIFRKYSDRFLYATDMTLTGELAILNLSAQLVVRFLETDDEFKVRCSHYAKGIKLEEEHLENIFYKNHERTVGKTPNNINKKALKKYIERYLPLFPDTRNKQLIEEYYRKNLL